MSNFHESIRSLLEDVQFFLAASLQHEALSNSTIQQKDNLLAKLNNFSKEYPQLQLSMKIPLDSFHKSPPDRPESVQSTSPLSYVDMNGANYRPPTIAEDGGCDVVKDRPVSKECLSLTESEDTAEESEKSYPEIAAKDLYTCEKYGYLDKKKRDSLKGWLNPFQKRWCAIKDGALHYYEKSTDRKQKGSILLSGYEARQIHELNKDGKKYSYCFELVCPGRRTYQFAASTKNDMNQWIVAVEQNNKVSDSGLFKAQDKRNTNSTIATSDSLSYITEDIYECVEDVGDVPPDKSIQKLFDKESADDDASSEKCYTDAESIKPQKEVFNPTDWYVGLWDCWGNDETELNFLRGDCIHVISKEYDSLSWWIGEFQGKIGFVPKSYLMEAYEPC